MAVVINNNKKTAPDKCSGHDARKQLFQGSVVFLIANDVVSTDIMLTSAARCVSCCVGHVEHVAFFFP